MQGSAEAGAMEPLSQCFSKWPIFFRLSGPLGPMFSDNYVISFIKPYESAILNMCYIVILTKTYIYLIIRPILVKNGPSFLNSVGHGPQVVKFSADP